MSRKHGIEIKGKTKKENPHCKIIIFCEGSTEEIYLQHFHDRSNNIEIVSVNPKHTNAVGIVEYARKYIDKNPLNKDLGDRGYCVFDADPVSNTNLYQAFDELNRIRRRGLRFIFSNPCFEIWFVMHFIDPPYGQDAQHIKQQVKELIGIPKYTETSDIYDILLPYQSKALKTARNLDRSQREVHDTVYSYECNPYTNIYEFIEYIQSL